LVRTPRVWRRLFGEKMRKNYDELYKELRTKCGMKPNHRNIGTKNDETVCPLEYSFLTSFLNLAFII
jgi:hypothetical protein